MATTSSKLPSGGASSQAQIWLFLTEEMSTTSFNHGDFALAEVKKMDLTLQHCLKLSGAQGQAQEFSFWIYSQSMNSAVQMLTDESIIATADMETFEEITDKGNMVSIVKDGETFTFTRDHLKGCIESELANLKLPTGIVVQSLGFDGRTRSVQLTS
ncbi:hypothetical protein S40285_10292 [Stachybotrys chlorohalonatus IBT 40285]|uniref:Uncharacterized protein n=1 Tax=Stachybotrys chlorohalonatus (strain IBT 40285) TaxID=1283841 RepID=A0A084QTA4_STAC4|nr:hypothetical protein S40285_10292 [Stachybotrys chlorohalonata IBT 40285]